MPQIPTVVRFGQHDHDLAVEIRNDNTDVGLVRSAFSIAAIAADGSIIQTFGTDGVFGAPCCTIYQLPPGGAYGFQLLVTNVDPPVARVELRLPSAKWVKWRTIKPATAMLATPTLQPGDFVPSLTGRLDVDQPGPFNVVVMGFLEADGQLVGVLIGNEKCVTQGEARPISVRGSLTARPIEGTSLSKVVAYVTTVAGAGDVSKPPGC